MSLREFGEVLGDDLDRDTTASLLNDLRRRDEALLQRVSALEAGVLAMQAQAAQATARSAGGEGPLRLRAADRFMPEAWTGEGGARPFADFAYDVENYFSVVDPSGVAQELLAWSGVYDGVLHTQLVADLVLQEDRFLHARDLDAALSQLLTKCTQQTARTMVRQAGAGNGFESWRRLSAWYRPRSAMDLATSVTRIINPGQCRDVGALHRRLEEWEVALRDHESRFADKIQESVRIAAVLSMVPQRCTSPGSRAGPSTRTSSCARSWGTSWPIAGPGCK